MEIAVMNDGTLRVPGATLFYRVRGSGPPLVILPGGDGAADSVDAVSDQLVDRYRVVTYDRRGLSRSRLDAPAEGLTLATHSDDAHRLLAALTTEPAFVLGSSIGALIGLDLVARHPEQVRVLVAHEPPAWELLPDAERERATRAQEDAENTFQRALLAGVVHVGCRRRLQEVRGTRGRRLRGSRARRGVGTAHIAEGGQSLVLLYVRLTCRPALPARCVHAKNGVDADRARRRTVGARQRSVSSGRGAGSGAW
jgi:pimeloyl-ACP methyl ester carboxylesterase